MPFGLTNAPATFQITLGIVLSRFKWQTCLVYLDDVNIFSNNEKHFKHIDQTLAALNDAGITFKLQKCCFFPDKVKYLEHVIRPDTLEVDHTHIRALTKARHPRTKTKLHDFLTLGNIYHHFVHNYSKIPAPLSNLFCKRTAGPTTCVY